ncbi:hypothetical protein Dsin_023482 [Dipteronia sinensis]|uniref:Uncharacterized protein n=1 Tax=Dipteronia sinensis TaxID=43782 RepID=A0AAE0E250_9ROSI|nr:hypothetical protein Dsin_023482 [Dipteronia sinensis]
MNFLTVLGFLNSVRNFLTVLGIPNAVREFITVVIAFNLQSSPTSPPRASTFRQALLMSSSSSTFSEAVVASSSSSSTFSHAVVVFILPSPCLRLQRMQPFNKVVIEVVLREVWSIRDLKENRDFESEVRDLGF